MACFKTLSLSGGCVLDTCQTKDAYMFDTEPDLYQTNNSIAYSPDHCYCVMIYFNDLFTTVYLGKYDPATNTLVQKHDFGADQPNQMVYDATAEKFVLTDNTSIFTYDPVSEVVDSFNPGVTGVIGSLIYIPEKGKVYGIMGVNGSNERFVGYIDLGSQTVVQLGFFPAIGAGRPQPTGGFAYSTVADALYGNWVSGINQRLCKFDLASNVGSYIVIGVNGAPVWWDADRNLLLMTQGSAYYEFDTATDTVAFSMVGDPDFWLRKITFKDALTNTVWGRGEDFIGGFNCLVGLDLNSNTWVLGLTDYIYASPVQFDGGSCIVAVTDLAETQSGIRKVCVL